MTVPVAPELRFLLRVTLCAPVRVRPTVTAAVVALERVMLVPELMAVMTEPVAIPVPLIGMPRKKPVVLPV